jgi:hypothetical protein
MPVGRWRRHGLDEPSPLGDPLDHLLPNQVRKAGALIEFIFDTANRPAGLSPRHGYRIVHIVSRHTDTLTANHRRLAAPIGVPFSLRTGKITANFEKSDAIA